MTNTEIIQAWYYGNRDHYETRYKNISFHRDNLYSYSSLLAKHENGDIHINAPIARYSATSIGHAGALRNVCCQFLEYDFEAPYASLIYEMKTTLSKSRRARKVDYSYQLVSQLELADSLLQEKIINYTEEIMLLSNSVAFELMRNNKQLPNLVFNSFTDLKAEYPEFLI